MESFVTPAVMLLPSDKLFPILWFQIEPFKKYRVKVLLIELLRSDHSVLVTNLFAWACVAMTPSLEGALQIFPRVASCIKDFIIFHNRAFQGRPRSNQPQTPADNQKCVVSFHTQIISRAFRHSSTAADTFRCKHACVTCFAETRYYLILRQNVHACFQLVGARFRSPKLLAVSETNWQLHLHNL